MQLLPRVATVTFNLKIPKFLNMIVFSHDIFNYTWIGNGWKWTSLMHCSSFPTYVWMCRHRYQLSTFLFNYLFHTCVARRLQVAVDLIQEFHRNNITLLTSEVFQSDPTLQVRNLKVKLTQIYSNTFLEVIFFKYQLSRMCHLDVCVVCHLKLLIWCTH